MEKPSKEEIEDYFAFKAEYEKAVKEGKDQFIFKGSAVLTNYAQYTLEYLKDEYEPKIKESVEEAAEKYVNTIETNGRKIDKGDFYGYQVWYRSYLGFISGAKWQANNNVKMYTEEEILNILKKILADEIGSIVDIYGLWNKYK